MVLRADRNRSLSSHVVVGGLDVGCKGVGCSMATRPSTLGCAVVPVVPVVSHNVAVQCTEVKRMSRTWSVPCRRRRPCRYSNRQFSVRARSPYVTRCVSDDDDDDDIAIVRVYPVDSLNVKLVISSLSELAHHTRFSATGNRQRATPNRKHNFRRKSVGRSR